MGIYFYVLKIGKEGFPWEILCKKPLKKFGLVKLLQNLEKIYCKEKDVISLAQTVPQVELYWAKIMQNYGNLFTK